VDGGKKKEKCAQTTQRADLGTILKTEKKNWTKMGIGSQKMVMKVGKKAVKRKKGKSEKHGG